MTTIALQTVCIDCFDAHEMADFYGRLLGWEPTFSEPDWVLMRDPGGGAGLSFQADPQYVAPIWPEKPGEQQKMIHLDIRVTTPKGDDASDEDKQAALAEAVNRAVSFGGHLATYQPRHDLRIILDPAGHPLCFFLD